MRKAKSRTSTTIVVMTLLAIIILLFYFYWTNRTSPIEDASANLTEVEKILNKDLELYYPETPREVVKLFGNMMKSLYDNPKDEEVEALALKLRELYDSEFLTNNPQDAYLQNIISDIAAWKEKDRRITNYLLINENMEQENEIDGVNYAVNYISFTIQEGVKISENWKILLRQDEDKKWKILGWEFVVD
jgi:hypothetical protein